MVWNADIKILENRARFDLALIVILCLVYTASWSDAAMFTYKDKMGRVVDVQVPVKRAVFLISYELIPVLGVWENVVGIGRWGYDNDLINAIKPDIRRSIPSVGSGIDINIEALLKLKPDIVLTWAINPEAVKFMEKRGLTVIAIYPESISELYEVMRLHGRLFQREKRIEEAINEMERLFLMIRKKVCDIPEGERKKVLYLGGNATSVSGGIGVTNDIIILIGARNPASIIARRNAEVPIEKIIAWNPDVIIIWGNAKYNVSDLTGNPQWRLLEAVKRGRVFKAPEWSTWSPRLAPFALWMATVTYPEYFKDIDFNRTTDRFHRKVFGISLQTGR